MPPPSAPIVHYMNAAGLERKCDIGKGRALSGRVRQTPGGGSKSENRLTFVGFSSKTITATITIEPGTERWLASEHANFSTGCAGPRRGPAREIGGRRLADFITVATCHKTAKCHATIKPGRAMPRASSRLATCLCRVAKMRKIDSRFL